MSKEMSRCKQVTCTSPKVWHRDPVEGADEQGPSENVFYMPFEI